MKKILFLFALVTLAVSVKAQNVIYDATGSTGVRTVVTEGVLLDVNNDMDIYVALAGFKYNSTVRYSLAMTIGSGHKLEVPGTSVCTLTLDNGKTLQLSTVAGGTSVLQDVEIDMDVAYQTYRRFAYYNIKEKELKKFKKTGVSQMVVQLSPSNYTISFSQDQLGSLLLSSMNVIKGMFGK